MTATLIGRTATAKVGSYDETVTIRSISRWEKDGMIRDYVDLACDGRRTFGKVFLAREGKVARADFVIDTPQGQVAGFYGVMANSGAKRSALDGIITELFA